MSRGQKPTLNHFTEGWHMVNFCVLLIMLFKGADCNLKVRGWIRLGDMKCFERYFNVHEHVVPSGIYLVGDPISIFWHTTTTTVWGKHQMVDFWCSIGHSNVFSIASMLMEAVAQISNLSTLTTFSIIYQLSCLLIWTDEFSLSWFFLRTASPVSYGCDRLACFSSSLINLTWNIWTLVWNILAPSRDLWSLSSCTPSFSLTTDYTQNGLVDFTAIKAVYFWNIIAAILVFNPFSHV